MSQSPVVTVTFRWTDGKRIAVGALGVAYALAALAVARVPEASSYAARSGRPVRWSSSPACP